MSCSLVWIHVGPRSIAAKKTAAASSSFKKTPNMLSFFIYLSCSGLKMKIHGCNWCFTPHSHDFLFFFPCNIGPSRMPRLDCWQRQSEKSLSQHTSYVLDLLLWLRAPFRMKRVEFYSLFLDGTRADLEFLSCVPGHSRTSVCWPSTHGHKEGWKRFSRVIY